MSVSAFSDKPFHDPLYIVGIGASAGGLEALERFFDNMPPDNGMAFVVVQHLSPDYRSMMVEILSKRTEMKVLEASEGVTVKPNHVYLIPRNKNMTIYHRQLFLSDKDQTRGLNLPIDIFFHSLAQDLGSCAVGIVLSGTGSDGTRGIRAIKELDGMVMVQDVSTAKFDGMPNSAIATGLTDYILPPETMPSELCKFIQHPYVTAAKSEVDKFTDDDTLGKILAILRTETGVDFSGYKANSVQRRIQRRMSINQLDHAKDYVRFLQRSQQEIQLLYKELLIGVTKFFRDPEAFDSLKRIVLPRILQEKSPYDAIRVWVSSCSTGEEAYSIAMLFAEYLEEQDQLLNIKIFATDIDKNAINYASSGLYPESIVADVSMERLQHFFLKKENKYQVNARLRQMVIFARHNLLGDPPFAKMDLVSCRNLLIYMKPETQERLLTFFHFSLKHQGFLFLGNSESIGENTYLFNTLDTHHRIYQYKAGYKLPLPSTSSKENLLPASSSKPKDRRAELPVEQEHKNAYLQNYHSPKMLSQKRLSEMILNTLSERYIPTCIIVNEENEVIHTLGPVEHFLKVPRGEMNFNLSRMLQAEYASVLRTAIHNVLKNNKELAYDFTSLKSNTDNVEYMVKSHVFPLFAPTIEPRLIAITFETQDKQNIADYKKIDINSDFAQHVNDLEKELQYTRENLQAAIEELETSNEELQATNEELLAANEELQSTNEELQSVNEELVTVNSEYQYKIEELIDVNNDINNLLNGSHVGILFLDAELRIKRFTANITDELYLMDFDIGRPIQHISHNLKYDNFINEIKQVIRKQEKYEHEVESKSGHWYCVRLLPYLTTENQVQGVMITLSDISEQRKERQSQLFLAAVAETLDDAIIGHDLNKQIMSWNKGATSIFDYQANEVIDQPIDILIPHELREEAYQVAQEAMINGKVFRQFETVRLGRTGNPIALKLDVCPIYDNGPHCIGCSWIIRTLTNSHLSQASHAAPHLDYQLLETSAAAVLVVTPEGRISFVNQRAEVIFEKSKAYLLAYHYDQLPWVALESDVDDAKVSSNDLIELLNDPQPFYNQTRLLKCKDNTLLQVRVNGAPLVDKTGHVYSVIFSLVDVSKQESIATHINAVQQRGDS